MEEKSKRHHQKELQLSRIPTLHTSHHSTNSGSLKQLTKQLTKVHLVATNLRTKGREGAMHLGTHVCAKMTRLPLKVAGNKTTIIDYSVLEHHNHKPIEPYIITCMHGCKSSLGLKTYTRKKNE